jgi:hypothetical protein
LKKNPFKKSIKFLGKVKKEKVKIINIFLFGRWEMCEFNGEIKARRGGRFFVKIFGNFLNAFP